jgi:Tfp pilus assembly protein PilV
MDAVGRAMWKRVRNAIAVENGFTLLEAMLAILLLTFGLLAVADVFPRGLGLGQYGKDQTKATILAIQEAEDIKYQSTAWITTKVGDYASAGTVATAYFDQNGASTTQTLV